MNDLTFEKFISEVKSYNPNEVDIITKAYNYASKLHDGQKRQSGEDYIVHPLNVAYTLALMHADRDTVCASLLHDTLEDTSTSIEEIENMFNKDVASLVDGVTKISRMSFSTKEEQNYANTRKIITSITKDVRIIIIKLADRLHNMRTLEYKSINKQKENSIETLELFVPLAYMIGAYKIKNELEDLAFYYINKETYLNIKNDLIEIKNNYDKYLDEIVYKLDSSLKNDFDKYMIDYRVKNTYSVFKNIQKGFSYKDIHDLFALKIVVNNISDCYRALGVVHSCYNPLFHKFKDFICSPKTNKYQSLHTTIFGPSNILVQTQIRTFDMDLIDTYGITQYWNINKGLAREKMQEDITNKYQFYKSLSDINDKVIDNKVFVERFKREVLSDKVYFYDTYGSTIELPYGSIILDYAYLLGEEIGNRALYGIVNKREVPLNYVIQNKDIVNIFTSDKCYGSNINLLDSVITTNAREKILSLKRSIS